MGIALPLFAPTTQQAVPTVQTFTDPMSGVTMPASAPPMMETFGLLGVSLLFLLLAWLIPARAARMAAGPALGLSGSDIVAGAMTTARFGMLMGSRVLRGTSQLLARA